MVRDLSGRYLYGNARAQLDMGCPTGLDGQSLDTVFTPEVAEVMRRRDQSVAESGSATISEGRFVLPDGHERSLVIATHRLMPPDGEPLVVSVVTDRTDAAHEPSESEIRFEQLVNSIEDVFVLSAVDPPMTLYASPNVRAMYGLDVDMMTIPNLLAVVYPEDQATLAAALQALRPSRLESEVEYRVLHPEKGLRWLRARTRPVTGPAGDARMATVVNDITADRELRQQLAHARDEAEAANSRKDELLSNVSHELRTPLHAMLGFTELLDVERETLTDDQRECVHQIRKAGLHLLDLINEILDIKRIERGHLTLSLETIDVEPLVRDTLELLAAHAEAQHVQVATMPPPETVRCRADRQRLAQVLINLVANAIKFNRAGGTVTVAWRATDDGQVRLDVIDDGIGIEPDDVPLLFIPFERLGSTQHVEGTGVGLALSRQLVHAMGGSITVESEVGEGTTFAVTLPAPDPEDLALHQ